MRPFSALLFLCPAKRGLGLPNPFLLSLPSEEGPTLTVNTHREKQLERKRAERIWGLAGSGWVIGGELKSANEVGIFSPTYFSTGLKYR